jgi:hypothetical protein
LTALDTLNCRRQSTTEAAQTLTIMTTYTITTTTTDMRLTAITAAGAALLNC